MKKFIIAVGALVSMGIASAAVEPFKAQRTMQCGDVYELNANLAKNFGEKPVMRFSRVNTNGNVMIIIFLNKETGTSTIVEAVADGTSCILTEGENMSISKDLIGESM